MAPVEPMRPGRVANPDAGDSEYLTGGHSGLVAAVSAEKHRHPHAMAPYRCLLSQSRECREKPVVRAVTVDG
jgi:hypothetical protein